MASLARPVDDRQGAANLGLMPSFRRHLPWPVRSSYACAMSVRVSPAIPLTGLVLCLALSACSRPDQVWEAGDEQDFVTIYEIQGDPRFDTRPEVGSEVAIRSIVVTAFDVYAEPKADLEQRGEEIVCIEQVGYIGGLVVQEFQGGPYSGVSLFNPTIVPDHQRLGPGDLVDIRGEYLEFCLAGEDYRPNSYCEAPDTNRLTQLGSATASKVGEVEPPQPIEVAIDMLAREDSAEPYEGVLVKVNQRLRIAPCDDPGYNCCVGDYDRYGNLCAGGQFERGRCDGGIELTNEFYSLPEGTTCVTSVTGILSWFGHESQFGEYRLSPRGPNDVTIPDECRGGH